MPRKTPPDRPARDLPGRRTRPSILGEGLSPDDAREAVQNLASFFRLLDSWDRTGAAAKPASTPPAVTAKVAGKRAAKVTVKVTDKVAAKVAAKVAGRGPRARGRSK